MYPGKVRTGGGPGSRRRMFKVVSHKPSRYLVAIACLVVALAAGVSTALAWKDSDFAHRPLFAYPLPHGKDNIIGSLLTYRVRKGDTLLDIGRWFGLTAPEISDANNHLDWWAPPVGRKIVLPDEHILPDAPRSGIIVNVPELRLYYYKGHVVYTFPVGLGRYDWRTPVGKTFRVTSKQHNPPWIVPADIYKEHLERDGWADRMIPGGDPDNPEGFWRLNLNLPQYAIHGTNNPWGVGMEVSHGCIRLYPEDIDRLWHLVPVGTKGHIIYEPVKFGWRGGSLYVEVHPDIYNEYPGLWNAVRKMVVEKHLQNYVDYGKLEKAVTDKTGVPTYIMPGPPPPGSYNGEVEALSHKTRPPG
jgi:L,D-transpeptidase ErfK/SrfK